MTDKNEDIREFLENLPDTFDILEEGVDVQAQNEYINYPHSFDCGKLTETETINPDNVLLETLSRMIRFPINNVPSVNIQII